ncbi:MAG: hypothetical protein JSR53_19185 [Proteobacteria bacterium]|nr:hypothetical protein [Pseudomonadota bacterium]
MAGMKLFFLTSTFAIVIPAQAGIQWPPPTFLDSRLRGNDCGGASVAPRFHALRVARSVMEN